MPGKKNVYTCRDCAGQTVTIDLDQGTTQVMIACKATPNCLGMMYSSMYRCDQELEPEYEWFRPDLTPDMSDQMQAHVRMGGLDIRKIEASDR